MAQQYPNGGGYQPQQHDMHGGGYQPQQPIMMQPAPTVIINNQGVAPKGIPQNIKAWSSGICGCCNDCCICCLGWMFPLALGCMVSNALNENCCVPTFLNGGVMAMRTKTRTMYGIHESLHPFVLYGTPKGFWQGHFNMSSNGKLNFCHGFFKFNELPQKRVVSAVTAVLYSTATSVLCARWLTSSNTRASGTPAAENPWGPMLWLLMHTLWESYDHGTISTIVN